MTIITTTKGPMDTSLLEKKTGGIDDENELTNWVEYWLDGELIHRSVHVHLKKNVAAESIAAAFPGAAG
ncbi:hypothetical protein LCGC14_3077140 [marine sediment metagenome]|uniref:Uncharacterized protein n=1 Tax=marine sediment metagenome TaxID=412755 RepID=A0A0F8WF49_9ZZZZ